MTFTKPLPFDAEAEYTRVKVEIRGPRPESRDRNGRVVSEESDGHNVGSLREDLSAKGQAALLRKFVLPALTRT